MEYGFHALIAPSFADIFYNNCFKNGLLPITLDDDVVEELFHEVEGMPGYKLTVDLEKQMVHAPASSVIEFDIEPSRLQALMEGIDEIGMTLKHRKLIKKYEAERQLEAPWLYPELS